MTWEEYEKKVKWDEALDLFLTSNFGTNIYFWKDGSISTLQYNEHPIDNSDVVAVVKCPGIGNIDTSYYTEDFLYNEDKGVWIDEVENVEAGSSIEDVIRYLIKEVGLSEDLELLQEEVEMQGKMNNVFPNRNSIEK